MTLRVALHHRTTYRYDRSITLGPQVVRLRPAYHGRTPVVAYDLTVHPEDHFINWQQDPFANPMARLVFNETSDRFEVVVAGLPRGSAESWMKLENATARK